LVVEAGRSRYQLATGDAAAFPALPDVTGGGVQLDPAALRQLLARVAPYVSQDDSRPAIAGALLEVSEGKLRAVATDGSRLCLDAMPFDGQLPATILHRRALGVLLPMLESAMLRDEDGCAASVAGANLRFDVGPLTLICRRIEANFPDYTKVVPDATGRGLQVAAETLGREVRRVSVMLRADGIMHVVADGEHLLLDAADVHNGDAHAEVEVGSELPALGLNPKYLADACAIGGTLTIEARDTLSPVRVTSDAAPEWVAVLMPMRL
jgi:DNA polymerase-3 subunit beta